MFVNSGKHDKGITYIVSHNYHISLASTHAFAIKSPYVCSTNFHLYIINTHLIMQTNE